MKSRRTLSTIIILLVGVVIGFTIAVLIGAIGSYVHPITPLTWPKKFGDIKVWAQRPSEAGYAPHPEVDKMLVMTRNNIPFLIISRNEAGKTDRLLLLNDKEKPVFRLEPLSTQGKWGQAAYRGYNEADKLVGNAFTDIDFDGHFDIKLALDANGNLISKSIFMDDSWQKVDRCNADDMIAVLGQTKYIFDPNFGWQVSK